MALKTEVNRRLQRQDLIQVEQATKALQDLVQDDQEDKKMIFLVG